MGNETDSETMSWCANNCIGCLDCVCMGGDEDACDFLNSNQDLEMAFRD